MSINRTHLSAIRPAVSTEPTSTAIEAFQNEVLRPILKLQHDLLIPIYQHYIEQRKGVFYRLQPKKRLEYIQHSIRKDSKLRELLIGVVVGHFTLEEWEGYLAEEKAIRKRLLDLLVQRVQSVEFFNLAD